MRQSGSFDERLLARLGKLDQEQLQSYLSRILSQNSFLVRIFDHLDEGVVVTDKALSVVFVNNRARRMFGWPQNRSFVGEDLGEKLAADHPLRPTIVSLRGNLREIEGYECEWGARKDRTLILSTLLIREDEPADRPAPAENPLMIILLRDMTERRRRQAEQARAGRLASMATLTSGIAHEIKNPLNSLNIHAQLLREEVQRAREMRRAPNIAKTERASEVIMEESTRLGRVVDEFLQAARPRSPHLEPRALQLVFANLERIFRPECELKGIAFTVSVDLDLPPLMLDEHLFVQALRNLIRNAIEALEERIKEALARHEAFVPKIQLSAEVVGEGVRITIADNGPGIPPGLADQVFEPYFTTKYGGTGLGLMVVYRIVTEHGGLIQVDTQPESGTRFVIALPLHQKPVRLLKDK